MFGREMTLRDCIPAPWPVEFEAWPKTPRLFRDIVITEKIDGTNAGIIIGEDGTVTAQSRTRLITPDDDNYGFARWVEEYKFALSMVLGIGRHFGEWWGAGIQRRYGKAEKTFSLFNTAKWSKVGLHHYCPTQLDVVPVLYAGPFTTEAVDDCLIDLFEGGSVAAPGFMQPEGVCVFHTAARTVFKATLEGDQAKAA